MCVSMLLNADWTRHEPTESLENVHETRNRFAHAVVNLLIFQRPFTCHAQDNTRHIMTYGGLYVFHVIPRTNQAGKPLTQAPHLCEAV